MNGATDAVPAQFTHHVEAVAVNFTLHRAADVASPVPNARGAQPGAKSLFGA
jgi:hypothetical protein